MSLNVTKRPFGHLNVIVGNIENVGKSCNANFQNNTICMLETLDQQINKF